MDKKLDNSENKKAIRLQRTSTQRRPKLPYARPSSEKLTYIFSKLKSFLPNNSEDSDFYQDLDNSEDVLDILENTVHLLNQFSSSESVENVKPKEQELCAPFSSSNFDQHLEISSTSLEQNSSDSGMSSLLQLSDSFQSSRSDVDSGSNSLPDIEILPGFPVEGNEPLTSDSCEDETPLDRNGSINEEAHDIFSGTAIEDLTEAILQYVTEQQIPNSDDSS